MASSIDAEGEGDGGDVTIGARTAGTATVTTTVTATATTIATASVDVADAAPPREMSGSSPSKLSTNEKPPSKLSAHSNHRRGGYGGCSEDVLLFGGAPGRVLDAIIDAIDRLLVEEVSALPLLPRRESFDEGGRDVDEDDDNNNDNRRCRYGEEGLTAVLWRVYGKNFDVADLYASRNVFTIAAYPKAKRRAVLVDFLDGTKAMSGSVPCAPVPPLPPRPRIDTDRHHVDDDADADLLRARDRFRAARSRRRTLRDRLDRLLRAAGLLVSVEGVMANMATTMKIDAALCDRVELEGLTARASGASIALDEVREEREVGSEGAAPPQLSKRRLNVGASMFTEDYHRRNRLMEMTDDATGDGGINGGCGAESKTEMMKSFLTKIRGEKDKG